MFSWLKRKKKSKYSTMTEVRKGKIRVEYSRLAGSWVVYVFDGEKFVLQGSHPTEALAIQAAGKLEV